MKIKPGIYVGSTCSLIVKDDEFGGQITVVVNDDQLELLTFYRNYDFNFDKGGENTGSGCGTTAWYKNKGEIVYHGSVTKVNEE